MKITMDGKYQTRDGRDVRIYALDSGDEFYPVHGAILYDNLWVLQCWGPEGQASVNEKPFDLIEKPEEIEVDEWVWVNKHGCLLYNETPPFDEPIARIHIKRTVKVGEGL